MPFTQEALLGQMRQGDYAIQYMLAGGELRKRSLNVSRAPVSTIDSLPYAAVSGAFISDVVPSGEDLVVRLQGVLNSTCTELRGGLKVERIDDVLVVLPVLTVRGDLECAQALIPFEKEVVLGRLEAGQYLVHVSSMNGAALNRVVQVRN